ncbi:MAG: Fe-S-containing hydro-lyase [Clostridiales bacterium]|nr:Fe-S-containing hydro-lyase [Clostridiales bacterium]
MHYDVQLPLTEETAKQLRAGDSVTLSGPLYTARDAAHARLTALLHENKPLPFPIENASIYYVGPTPAKPGQVIGSAGPTTSSRMDVYTPALLDRGLRGMIGKGVRNGEVIAAMKRNGAVCFGAIGGAGALLSDCIKEAEVVAFEDLGAEAICRLELEKFPVVVVIDTLGNDLYQIGRAQYLQERDQE